MRFAFTDDHLAFSDTVHALLAKECTPDHLRAASATDGRIPGVWSQLVDMGVVGALAPVGVGGTGLDEVALIRMCFEAGYAALPEPLSDTALVVVPALRDHAVSADAEAWLERICSGGAIIGLGLAANRGLVDHAIGAPAFLLEAGDGLHLVDADVVSIEPVDSVDPVARPARVRWTPSSATLVVGSAVGATEARSRAALGSAAELCGLSRRMIEMTVGYVSERRQFGVPIGSFQAIKHHLANALGAVAFAEPLVWRAAVSLAEHHPESSVHVAMAKAQASDAAQLVADLTLQCHGAIAYTVEYDLQFFMKRAWVLARRDGSARSHRATVRAALLGA